MIVRNDHRLGTAKYNLKYELSVTKGQFVEHEDYCIAGNCRTKNSHLISWGYLELLAVFKILYLCISRFLAGHLTIFSGTYIWKHWCK